MVIAFERSTSLAFVLVLSVFSTLVRSQAPDDKDSHSCEQSPVPDGVFRLLDSSWYELLSTTSGDNAGWTMTPADSWTESGSFCSRRLASCDSTSSNWLVTQYISKSAQASYALGITVDLNGEVSYSCIQDSSCSNSVNVYYYPSSGPITSGQQLNTDNYQSIGSVSFGFTTETKSVTFSLGSEFDRFYIAIKEENSCFTLRKLQVSYGVCSAMEDGLVVYPNIPIGSTNVPASASCKANAAVSPGSSLDITCNTNGTFSGSPSCSCLAGRIGATCFPCAPGSYAEFGDTTCTKCLPNSNSKAGASSCHCNANFYKNSDGTCLSCPANSMSKPESTNCSCITNYYRALADSITDACTTAPSEPQALTVTTTSINATLSWTSPLSDGGRDDVFYNIKYKTMNEQQFSYYASSSSITATSAIVTSLVPLTNYTFVVVAENGVSQDFPHQFSEGDRTSAAVSATTKEGVPSAPTVTILGGEGAVVILEPPEMPNGVIINYDLKFTGQVVSHIVTIGTKKLYYVPSLMDVPESSDGTVTVEVRGRTATGGGAWSNPQELSVAAIQCLETGPSIQPTKTSTVTSTIIEFSTVTSTIIESSTVTSTDTESSTVTSTTTKWSTVMSTTTDQSTVTSTTTDWSTVLSTTTQWSSVTSANTIVSTVMSTTTVTTTATVTSTFTSTPSPVTMTSTSTIYTCSTEPTTITNSVTNCATTVTSTPATVTETLTSTVSSSCSTSTVTSKADCTTMPTIMATPFPALSTTIVTVTASSTVDSDDVMGEEDFSGRCGAQSLTVHITLGCALLLLWFVLC